MVLFQKKKNNYFVTACFERKTTLKLPSKRMTHFEIFFFQNKKKDTTYAQELLMACELCTEKSTMQLKLNEAWLKSNDSRLYLPESNAHIDAFDGPL